MRMTQMLADTAVVGRYIDHEIRIICLELFINSCYLFNVFST